MYDLGQRICQVVRAVEEPGELFCEMSLLVPLQFEEDVLLAREVEEEGSVRNARGSHDRVHIGACHTHALELGDRRVEEALPRLEPSSFPRRRLDLWRHGLPFVTQILTQVNELSQSEKISRFTECRYGMARNGVI